MIGRWALIACGLVLAGWAFGQNEQSEADLKKLQGKWELTAAVHDGKEEALKDKNHWTVKGDKVIYESKAAHQIALDATKKPRHIDVKTESKDVVAQLLAGIYQLDGDHLKVCVDVAGKGRPTAFESKAGSGWRLMTLKRVKE